MNPLRARSVNSRLEAIEKELSEHTFSIIDLDLYLLMIETALVGAKVFTKEDLDQLRAEVLKVRKKPIESKIIKV